MTTIHFSTTGELLHILDDYPEVLAELRRKLLTDDLLAMPESVRAIRETQREMQETQQRIADLLNQTAERLDALEARQAHTEANQSQSDARLTRIEASQERMEARQDQSDARLERIETKQDRMEATQAEMLQWQANADKRFDRIESGHERMEATQAEMLQWQANADKRFDRMEARQELMDGKLGNLTGEALERRAIDDFYHVARSEFGVARTEMIHVSTRHLRTISNRLVEPYEARIDTAKTNGLITIDEEFELNHADFVARGYSRQDATPVWFVAEVSGTIAFDDIRRAHERADILSRALSETVIPVTYGLRVSDRLRVVAETRGVRIAMRPQPDENYT